ncbi:hypothetical protein BLNAU_17295 [Blattamonas nauphoetae]|uniref:Uncharacterized protein n=1 Tax=Blattamonas nauphoetae TaxID=2049346 RepID=A0ABQ9WPF3_9EUKA|nr:hypothetical protein BLNAU_24739 [Blattamonas nauphoetae]KAK2947776.1 hypothetical protein BLNAU_17295 [Blattamonas nauphoetae]
MVVDDGDSADQRPEERQMSMRWIRPELIDEEEGKDEEWRDIQENEGEVFSNLWNGLDLPVKRQPVSVTVSEAGFLNSDKKKIEKDTSTTDNSKPESKTSINNEDKSELKKDTSQAPATKRESSQDTEGKSTKLSFTSTTGRKREKTKKETAKQKTPEEPKLEQKSPPEKEKSTSQPSEQPIPSQTETEPPKDDPPPNQNEATEEDKPKDEEAEEKPVNIEDQQIIIGRLQNMTFEEMIELKLMEDEERAKTKDKRNNTHNKELSKRIRICKHIRNYRRNHSSDSEG